MYKIIEKRQLAENVNEYVIESPEISRHCLAGQFVILRVDENGERVPFTICDYSRENKTISILVQTLGFTTAKLAKTNAGDCLQDLVGPLGNATDLSNAKKVLLVGGGIGTAVIHPQAKQLYGAEKQVDAIIGARNVELVMYADEMKKTTDNLYVMTDDGSSGNKGFVTDKIKELVESGNKYDVVFAVGPLPMMRAVCNLTKEFGIHTIVSMNSLMVDGTGMCGGCRVTVGGERKYACVDGPEFDGHLVDFDEAMARSKFYREDEQKHLCRLKGERK